MDAGLAAGSDGEARIFGVPAKRPGATRSGAARSPQRHGSRDRTIYRSIRSIAGAAPRLSAMNQKRSPWHTMDMSAWKY